MTSLQFKICFILIIAALSVHAQQDSVEVKYDSLYQQFIYEKEKPITHLWKLDLSGSKVLMPAISYEHKMGKNWSEETYAKFGLPWKDGFFPMKFEWELNQQLKYYYNFKRREKFGKSTNGFSGNYFAIEVFAGENYQPKPGIGSGTIVDRKSYMGTGLRFGMQRRLGTIGFMEPFFGLRLLYTKAQTSSFNVTLNRYNSQIFDNWGLESVMGIRAGFALDKILFQSNGSTNYKSIWKLNLADIGFLYSNIGFERFIWPNWSINTYLAGGGAEVTIFENYSNSFFKGFGSYYPKIEIEQQVRFYPIKTISCFSGNYAALEIFGGLKSRNYHTDDINFHNINHDNRYVQLRNYGASVKIGWQRILGKNGYIDLFAGLKYVNQEYPVFKSTEAWQPDLKIATKSHFKPVIGLKAGIALGTIMKNK